MTCPVNFVKVTRTDFLLNTCDIALSCLQSVHEVLEIHFFM